MATPATTWQVRRVGVGAIGEHRASRVAHAEALEFSG
jgi:hypothetical protein